MKFIKVILDEYTEIWINKEEVQSISIMEIIDGCWQLYVNKKPITSKDSKQKCICVAEKLIPELNGETTKTINV